MDHGYIIIINIVIPHMESIKKISGGYFNLLKDRSKSSRIYKAHQMTGLVLAGLLEDPKHKALYMKLAKNYDADELLQLAKNIAESRNINNKGAYFMKMLKENKIYKIPDKLRKTK